MIENSSYSDFVPKYSFEKRFYDLHQINGQIEVPTIRVIKNIDKFTFGRTKQEIATENSKTFNKYSHGYKGELKTSRVYFMLETEGKAESLTGVNLREYLMTESSMNILMDFLSTEQTITTLILWRVRLTQKNLKALSEFLHSGSTIRALTLDDDSTYCNPIVADFLLNECRLKELRIRRCGLGSDVGGAIARRLAENQVLLHLDLTGNKLCDDGATKLAEALNINRTLLSLSLANNAIGNEGCDAIAKSISEFTLSHEQIIKRRLLISAYLREAEQQRIREIESLSSIQDEQISKSSRRKTPPTNKSRGTKRESKTKIITKDKKTRQSSPRKDGPHTRKANAAENPEDVYKAQEHIYMDGIDSINPLLQKAKYIENVGLQVPGNFTLSILNLSMNKIEEAGLLKLRNAIQWQIEYLSSDTNISGHGLTHLILTYNSVQEGSELVEEIMHLISNRTLQKGDQAVTSNQLEESQATEAV